MKWLPYFELSFIIDIMEKKIKLGDLCTWLNSALDNDSVVKADSAMNGLQVGDTSISVSKVAFSVDCCEETILRASESESDILIVHHGLYWGTPVPVTGSHYRRLSALIKNGIGLYACHLPLDRHDKWGHNWLMAECLGLKDISRFGDYKGIEIGWCGELPTPLSMDAVSERLFGNDDNGIALYRNGEKFVSTVGIISGGAAFEVHCAVDLGLDLYVTGEFSHSVIHYAREEKINVIAAGHYRTETWGIKKLSEVVAKEFGIETCVIDFPTGL